MKQSNEFSLNIGLPTIFLVFVVLCLLSLETLTFVSAKADWQLCQRAIEHTQAYYDACNQAEEMISSFQDDFGSFTFPISDLQSLYVELEQNPDHTCKITTWKVITNNGIAYQNQLSVIP